MKKTTEKNLFDPEEIAVTPYDAAEFLDSEETITQYLAVSLEDPDPDIFLKALGNVLRAKGVATIAKETGLAREALYRTCQSGKKPHFDTILRITRAIGIPLGFPAPSHPGIIGKKTHQPKRRRKHRSATDREDSLRVKRPEPVVAAIP
jgi:probable addiction module antidote protein